MATKKKGDKTHKPTDKTRAEVSALYSFGHTQQEIASFLNIAIDTLVKHYQRELETARIIANSKVAQRLYNKAVTQDNLRAQIFWLKTQARWRTQDTEALVDQNERLRAEAETLRAQLNQKHKKDY